MKKIKNPLPVRYTAMVLESKEITTVVEREKFCITRDIITRFPRRKLTTRFLGWLCEKMLCFLIKHEYLVHPSVKVAKPIEVSLDHDTLFSRLNQAYHDLHLFYDGEPRTIYIGKSDLAALLKDQRFNSLSEVVTINETYKVYFEDRENKCLGERQQPLTIEVLPYLRGFLIV